MAVQERQAFTLRFDDLQTYQMLQLVTKQLGVSMNEFVQQAVQERLAREAVGVESRLQAALDVIHRYRKEDVERYADAFARAEVTEDDPVRATALNPQEDRLGVRKAFMQAVERSCATRPADHRGPAPPSPLADRR